MEWRALLHNHGKWEANATDTSPDISFKKLLQPCPSVAAEASCAYAYDKRRQVFHDHLAMRPIGLPLGSVTL